MTPPRSPSRRIGVVVLAVAAVIGVIGVVVVGNEVYQRRNNPPPDAWPDTDLGADHVVVYKDTDTRPLHLHAFTPALGEPAPAVVFFHGGGLSRTPLDQFVGQAEALAEAGLVAVIAEYRVAHDGGTPASSLSDAADAVRWLRSHADELPVDVARVAAAGASAGGWLAVDAANGTDPPDALALFNPAVQPSQAPPGSLPIVVFHGDDDRTVPVELARGFCAAAVDCRIDVWPGGDHGFFNEVHPEAHAHTTAELVAFFDELGWTT